MSVRLVLAIADAVRRHQQRQKKGEEEALPPAGVAAVDAKRELKDLLPADISVALLKGADWSQLAQQLMALKRAGVDLEQLLPRVGEIAVTVRDSVAANAERVAREGTGEWVKLLRETMPAGPVREAILSSPGWPDIAAKMGELDESGVDVRRVLASAHDEGLGVDKAIAKVLASGEAPAVSRGTKLWWSPLTVGLDVPENFDPFEDRGKMLIKLGIGPHENERFARMVREAMPGREREADALPAARQWPLLVAQMIKMEKDGRTVKDHLAGLKSPSTSDEVRGPELRSRMVNEAHNVLRHAPGEAPKARLKVSSAAARSHSSTVGPTN
ncbi:hypothetical protein ACFXGT_35640 [Streptomyces sp. NPDC059352]|uniref:hypothetical protein n=1 Tax=Streptomyces sp. NPDC059352 TaxID=3346810 RepID=UPI0036830B5F